MTKRKPVKCWKCGGEAVVRGVSGHMYVNCRARCWKGPNCDTEDEAIDDWDELMDPPNEDEHPAFKRGYEYGLDRFSKIKKVTKEQREEIYDYGMKRSQEILDGKDEPECGTCGSPLDCFVCGPKEQTDQPTTTLVWRPGSERPEDKHRECIVENSKTNDVLCTRARYWSEDGWLQEVVRWAYLPTKAELPPMPELKGPPCPFCGGKMDLEGRFILGFWYQCVSCGWGGTVPQPTKQEALDLLRRVKVEDKK